MDLQLWKVQPFRGMIPVQVQDFSIRCLLYTSLQGLISIESPLGKALKGHKVGERIFVKAGDGGYYVVIRKIENTMDDSHDTLRTVSYTHLDVYKRQALFLFKVSAPACAVLTPLVYWIMPFFKLAEPLES